MKRVAIVQSNYIPWKGYFDLIRSVDEFILYDDAQYTRRDWRNRNQIKTAQGLVWLTVPVLVKGNFEQAVKDTRVSEPGWAKKHLESFRHHYAKTPHFREIFALIEPLYAQAGALEHLSHVNRLFLEAICGYLGITTKLSWSMDYPSAADGKNEKLIELCAAAGAGEYLSGPAAKGYMDPALWAARGIGVEFFDYAGYPEYPQPHPPFRHDVSILDLLFCTGREAPRYLKGGAKAVDA